MDPRGWKALLLLSVFCQLGTAGKYGVRFVMQLVELMRRAAEALRLELCFITLESDSEDAPPSDSLQAPSEAFTLVHRYKRFVFRPLLDEEKAVCLRRGCALVNSSALMVSFTPGTRLAETVDAANACGSAVFGQCDLCCC
ncbi:hypothetical protein DNTS_025183 [Danionella cerebrum]|uniref:Secreted protein n=1 Tax=Danionella cerebrum TaxID=2873325 RepID=A0A553QY03_9TELE|nr:hypothetical protein DNTS_025183 [Danionella translucida]